MTTSASNVKLRRLWWAGPLTIAASLVAVLIVRVVAVAILQPDPQPMALSWIAPITFTVALVLVAVLVFAAVARFAKNPLRTWQVVAVIALLVSFVPDVFWAGSSTPGASWPNAIALMLMHVAAWAVCAFALPRLAVEPA